MVTKMTADEWIKEATRLRGGRFDYSRVADQWETLYKHVDVRCVEHERWFKTRPYDHLNRRSACRLCLKKARHYLDLLIESETGKVWKETLTGGGPILGTSDHMTAFKQKLRDQLGD